MGKNRAVSEIFPTEKEAEEAKITELDALFRKTQENLEKIAELLPRKASVPRITIAAQNLTQAQIEQNM